MKIFSLLFTLLLGSTIVFAQPSDIQQIETTLNYYLDGGTNNDFETLQKAFHENASMKFVRDGEYQEVNVLEFFEQAIKPGPPSNRQTFISFISVTGNTANAKLELKYENSTLVDYMNLLKIDGEWKIVSKIYTRL